MNIEDRILSLCVGPNKAFTRKISSICTDSKSVVPGSIFVALKGRKTDGHFYLESAVKNGAQVLVVENTEYLKEIFFSGLLCVVPNTYDILPILLNEFYDYPSEKMFCIGVTGTNGKTTVSNILAFLLSYCGWHTGIIGTIRNQLGQWEEKSVLTTPDPTHLYHLLDHFYKRNAQAVIMEVSSIGLDQQRVKGIDFNLGVFTNLSEDHLDYHQNMSEYFQAKKKLFVRSFEKNHFLSVLNLDDPYSVALVRDIQVPYISYGRKQARFTWNILHSDLSGTWFDLFFDKKKLKVFLSIPGIYNVSNAVAALCCVYSAGFDLEEAVKSLKHFPGVPGRLEKVFPTQYPLVFVDYAHTPQALGSVLSFLKQNKKEGSQLITVFGCGGERDQKKRPLMTQAAEHFSDQVVLTSDNPRGEDPQEIINHCLKGVNDRKKFLVEEDRKQAIEKALQKARKKDIVLIAGKGHEKEQIIGSERIPFSDVEVVKEFLLGKMSLKK